MQIHDFTKSVKNKNHKPTRVGRGGKRGVTSGRGQKGQKSRSGHKIRPAERDLIIRLPKLRGFANKISTLKPIVVTLKQLENKFKKFAAGKHAVLVNLLALQEAGLVSKNTRGVIKILGKGELSVPLTVKGLKVSEGAKAAIEKAGGKVE